MKPMAGRGAQMFLAMRLFFCGLGFYLASALWPDAMPADVYGRMAYDIDADTWALGFMAAAGMMGYGVQINGRWRWSPYLRIGGATMLFCMFVYLVASALSAPNGSVVVIFGALFFLPDLMLVLWSNLLDLRARHGAG